MDQVQRGSTLTGAPAACGRAGFCLRLGSAERPVGAEVRRRGGGVALQFRALVVGAGHGLKEPGERAQIASRSGVEGLLDQMVPRDVGGVDPVHGVGVGTQGAPAHGPRVEGRRVGKQPPHAGSAATGGLSQAAEEGRVVGAARLQKAEKLVHEGRDLVIVKIGRQTEFGLQAGRPGRAVLPAERREGLLRQDDRLLLLGVEKGQE